MSGEGSEVSDTEWGNEEISDFQDEEEPSAEQVKVPELFGLTEEQAVAALKEVGLNSVIEYCFDSTEKGYVCSYFNDQEYSIKGISIPVVISLGEYDGPIEMVKPEYATWYYPTKETKLEVPVPDGMSGSYFFLIYNGEYAEYSEYIEDISDVDSVTFDIQECDKGRRVIYAENAESELGGMIRYATYEFDYTAEKWSLIGELNTDELLNSMK